MSESIQYQLNKEAFRVRSELALLAKMLEMAGYHHGSEAFEALRKRAVAATRQAVTEQIMAWAQNCPEVELTATAALIAEANKIEPPASP